MRHGGGGAGDSYGGRVYLKRECAPADSLFEVKWSVNGR